MLLLCILHFNFTLYLVASDDMILIEDMRLSDPH